MNKQAIQEELLACEQILEGIAALLALPDLPAAKRDLLRQSAQLAQQRRQEAAVRLSAAGIAETGEPAAQRQLRANMLEAQVEALMQGHELQSWAETDDGGYEARCTHCEKSVYVSHKTLYSVLPASCLGRQTNER